MRESSAPRGYRPDDPYTVCERSGFKCRRSETVVEWTGLRVLKRFAEPRHPSLDGPPPFRGEEIVPDPRGRPIDVEE